MSNKQIAEKILQAVGGKENVASAAHCATRLRLVLRDENKVDSKDLDAIDEVKGTFATSGQFQIILGGGLVNKVYDEFIILADVEASSKEELKQEAAEKLSPFQKALRTLSDVFVPILPAIVATGLMMGLMEALNFVASNGYVAIDTSGAVFRFLMMFGNAAYIYLPILIAFSAAKVFGANQYVGAAIGMIMVHPDLQNAWTVAGEGVAETASMFGLFDVPLVGYQGHVIPVIVAVGIAAFIEKRVRKVTPNILELFIVPLATIFITGFVTLGFIGPVILFLEEAVLSGIQSLLTLPMGLGGLLVGGVYSATVVTGLHHSYIIIDLGMIGQYGYTYWLPIASAANVAQGGAALAVGLRTKNEKVKSVAIPAALSACLGITEPAIFGVNLRYKKPFIAAAIGGAAAGFFATIVNLGATGTGVTGILGILLHLHAPVNYIILFAIAFGVAFVMTNILGWNEEA